MVPLIGNLEKIKKCSRYSRKTIKNNKLIVVLRQWLESQTECKNVDEIKSNEKEIENDLVLTAGENVTIGFKAYRQPKKENKIYAFTWMANPILTDKHHQS